MWPKIARFFQKLCRRRILYTTNSALHNTICSMYYTTIHTTLLSNCWIERKFQPIGVSGLGQAW